MTFTPLPMPYSQVYSQLYEKGLITPIFDKPLQPPYPKWYNPDLMCEYHNGARGHDLDSCLALKNKVQSMIDTGALKFAQTPYPSDFVTGQHPYQSSQSYCLDLSKASQHQPLPQTMNQPSCFPPTTLPTLLHQSSNQTPQSSSQNTIIHGPQAQTISSTASPSISGITPSQSSQTLPPAQVSSSNQSTEPKKTIVPPPMPYPQIYQRLYEERLIAPVFVQPLQPPFPKWYNPSLTCEYHNGVGGHDLDTCTALKHKVQSLVSKGVLSFTDDGELHINTNPFSKCGADETVQTGSLNPLKDTTVLEHEAQGIASGKVLEKPFESKEKDSVSEEEMQEDPYPSLPCSHIPHQNPQSFHLTDISLNQHLHTNPSIFPPNTSPMIPIPSFAIPNPYPPNPETKVHRIKPHPKESKFDPIPMSYSELYPQLLQNQLVIPVQALQRKPPFPKWYDVNARCEYHRGAMGHSLENCLAFKKKVQELLNGGKLKF